MNFSCSTINILLISIIFIMLITDIKCQKDGPTTTEDEITTTDESDSSSTETDIIITSSTDMSSMSTSDPPDYFYEVACSDENATMIEEMLEDITYLNGLLFRRSTLELGDDCDFNEVDALYYFLGIQKGREVIPSGNPPYTPLQLVDICQTLRDKVFDGIPINQTVQLCNTHHLLYCDPDMHKCVCMDGFEAIGHSGCFLLDDSVCGASWKLDTPSEIKGLPPHSPKCESDSCIPSETKDKFKCDEDKWGLLMIKKSHRNSSPTSIASNTYAFYTLLYSTMLLLLNNF